jgi:hypothetical protein
MRYCWKSLRSWQNCPFCKQNIFKYKLYWAPTCQIIHVECTVSHEATCKLQFRSCGICREIIRLLEKTLHIYMSINLLDPVDRLHLLVLCKDELNPIIFGLALRHYMYNKKFGSASWLWCASELFEFQIEGSTSNCKYQIITTYWEWVIN